MNKQIINELSNSFESVAKILNGVEFWFARDLQILLDYAKWENFESVIEKAKASCKNSGFNINDHFPEVRKTINMPKGATKEINDFLLTRYILI